MKKLLALILCVVMVLSLAPAAFAADPVVPDSIFVAPGTNSNKGTMAKNIKDAVDSANDAIALAYGTLVGDQVVYGSVKSMDDLIVDIAKGLAGAYKIETSNEVVKGAKTAMRQYLGTYITKKMREQTAKFTDNDVPGKQYDPVKYAQVFADAVSSALSDGKFQKALEAAYTEAAYAQLYADIAKSLQDNYDAFILDVDDDLLKVIGDTGYNFGEWVYGKSEGKLGDPGWHVDPTLGLDQGVEIPEGLAWKP